METRNQTLASLILSSQQEMRSYRKDANGDVYFNFDDNECVREIEEGFYRNTIRVLAVDFVNAQRQVKGIIFKLKDSKTDGNTRRNTRQSTDDVAV